MNQLHLPQKFDLIMFLPTFERLTMLYISWQISHHTSVGMGFIFVFQVHKSHSLLVGEPFHVFNHLRVWKLWKWIRLAGLLLKIFKIFSHKEDKLKRWSFSNAAFREICVAEKCVPLYFGMDVINSVLSSKVYLMSAAMSGIWKQKIDGIA